MARFEEIMENEQFVNGLENVESYDALKDAFEKEGVNIDEVMDAVEADEAELTEADLEDVAGGVSGKDLARIVKQAYKTVKGGGVSIFKFGASCGILLVAYKDVLKYGDATHTYSEKTIMKAAKQLGCV